MKYNYAYQRSGHPLLSWKNGPPNQSRSGDTVGLGSLAEPTLVLPRPGAPEPINGCECHGKSGVGSIADSIDEVLDTITGLSMPVKVAGAVGLFLLYKKLKKKR